MKRKGVRERLVAHASARGLEVAGHRRDRKTGGKCKKVED